MSFSFWEEGFYKKKKVLITGHTGFKGTWLCKILVNLGAEVCGYALEPPTNPNLFSISNIENNIKSVYGDIRDYKHLSEVVEEFQPEIVIHMAAQPIVRESYKKPKETYETNVMGTVNILECVRNNSCVKSFLNVTTDKVYLNKEHEYGYKEDDQLDGFDPYSNSKSCSELITHSYVNSFFNNRDIETSISTARSGNVIGGGDFASDRIIPDCFRAVITNKPIEVRNPNSIRPYQHVLEPLSVYLEIVARQYKDKAYQGYYNVGPDDCDCITTGELVSLFVEKWQEGASWINKSEANAPHEATFLKLNCDKLKKTFDWTPRWHIDECIERTCDFYKEWVLNRDISNEMNKEISDFFERI